MKSNNPFRQYGRNTKAVCKRIRRAIGHRNLPEVASSVARLLVGILWTICVLCTAACLVAGFYKPHCFVMAVFYAVCVWAVGKTYEKKTA